MKDIAIAYVETTDTFIKIEWIDVDSVGHVYNITFYCESEMQKRTFNRVKFPKMIVDNHSKILKQALEKCEINFYRCMYFVDEKMNKRDKKHIASLKSNYELVVV